MQPPKVQPSSLVFVAIVASWAAYLLPRWMLRRDTLGQARGRDRHSTRLRVLERRRRPRSGSSSAPLLTTGAGPSPLPAPLTRTPQTPSAQTPSAQTPSAQAGPGLARRAAARRAAARRARVLGLLTTLTLASVAAVAFAHLPLWTPVPASALLLLDLAGLMITGRRRAAARRVVAREVALRTLTAGRRVEAALAADRRHRPAGAASRATAAPSATASAQASSSARTRTPAAAASAARPASTGAVALTQTPQGPVREQPTGELSGRVSARRTSPALVPVPALSPVATGNSGPAWTPVAVPPPTYTLKPVARRADPRPLDLTPTHPPTPSATAAAPRPWDIDPVTERPWADELDLDLVLARRRAVNA